MILGAFYSAVPAVFKSIVCTSENRRFSHDGASLRFVRIPIKKLVAPTSTVPVLSPRRELDGLTIRPALRPKGRVSRSFPS
jgi:hypothetical protein